MKTNKDLIIEPNAAIEGRKYSEEKPWSCKYCYWWEGKKKGCSLKQCHYLLSEKKKAVKSSFLCTTNDFNIIFSISFDARQDH